MLVRLTHEGGPLDGTIEFEEGSPPPTDKGMDVFLAWGTFDLTGGEVGKGAMAAAPSVTEAAISNTLPKEEAGKSTIHKYFITENEVRDGVRYVKAEHRPQFRG
ncbi:hypothetical protein [Crateriforma conspicua]|uniref:hypothetical protein n=1 Tax=Crateriforma conspicua TaxID=2527996 RepID=UPI00118795F6|nr:hypothetical protein [Crateriforma conspicua]QDV61961.1 hypothetical protein Mal65_10890 [Crateriforma conspicua]